MATKGWSGHQGPTGAARRQAGCPINAGLSAALRHRWGPARGPRPVDGAPRPVAVSEAGRRWLGPEVRRFSRPVARAVAVDEGGACTVPWMPDVRSPAEGKLLDVVRFATSLVDPLRHPARERPIGGSQAPALPAFGVTDVQPLAACLHPCGSVVPFDGLNDCRTGESRVVLGGERPGRGSDECMDRWTEQWISLWITLWITRASGPNRFAAAVHAETTRVRTFSTQT